MSSLSVLWLDPYIIKKKAYKESQIEPPRTNSSYKR